MPPVQVFDLTVALEYAVFSLSGGPLADAAADALDRVVDEAVAGQGIASTPGNEYVVVLSPHQNNFAMPLRVEVWPGEPPDDLDHWQEAFCTGLVVGAGGLVFESPTAESHVVPVPPGPAGCGPGRIPRRRSPWRAAAGPVASTSSGRPA